MSTIQKRSRNENGECEITKSRIEKKKKPCDRNLILIYYLNNLNIRLLNNFNENNKTNGN